jgi:3-hydroxyisobutyrate dehydrogenase
VRIGYIGLGNMGGALARRLALAGDVQVYDRDPAAVQRMADSGGTARTSAADLAAVVDAVILCMPTSDHVREVIFGAGGVAAAAKPGLFIIDQTSGDPKATRAMGAELSSRGIALVDAPVSGGAKGAEAGTIAIMVGATHEQYAFVQPILSMISQRVFHAGDLGAGHVMKLVNNLLSGAQRLLALEGMALAVKNGVEPEIALEILLAGGARNAYLERIMGAEVLTGRLNVGFTLGLAHKDIRLACQLGSDSGVPTFYASLTRELYQIYINEMGPTAEVDTAALVVDRLAGTRVVPPNVSAG